MVNIDRLCAEIGFSIPKDKDPSDPTKQLDPSKQENAIRKALAILSQEGIFAYLIYLESEGKNITWDGRRNTQKSIGDDEKMHRLIMFYSAKPLKKLDKLHPSNDFFVPEDEKLKLLLKGKNDRNDPDPIWSELKTTFRNELTKNGSILENIPQMFFVKQILEQMLTYALYRARSLR